MPFTNNSTIPASAGEVKDKLLKFKQGGPSVEEARAAMLAAREPATTTRMGVKVPEFIEKESSRGMGQGGNTPVVQNTHTELLTSAKQKLANLRIAPGTKVNLNKMRDAGLITQPEIDALLQDASKKSASIPKVPATEAPAEPSEPSAETLAAITESEESVNNEPVIETERVPVEPATSESEPESAAAKSIPALVATEPVETVLTPVIEKEVPDVRKAVETKKFKGQIFKEGKEWVAEITYKNGSGTERFVALSKDELMLKLLEGKGHGTIKVRETVARYKLGDVPDDWNFFWKMVNENHGVTLEEYNKYSEAAKDALIDAIQSGQALAFQESYPEYYGTAKNFQQIAQYLNHRNWPLTLHNLELAYRDLIEDDLLEQRPIKAEDSSAIESVESVAEVEPVQPPTTKVSVPASAPAVGNSPAAAATPAPVVSTAASAVAPAAPVVRKRMSTGLIPGVSSAAPATPKTEERNEPKEFSESELRKMSLPDLKRIATKDRKHGRY